VRLTRSLDHGALLFLLLYPEWRSASSSPFGIEVFAVSLAANASLLVNSSVDSLADSIAIDSPRDDRRWCSCLGNRRLALWHSWEQHPITPALRPFLVVPSQSAVVRTCWYINGYLQQRRFPWIHPRQYSP